MFTGIIIGAISFLIIGIFHPIVIKCEYHFSERVWPIFLISGLICCGISTITENVILSAALAITGFTMLWSIKELKEQKIRVEKGWFPKKPPKGEKTSADKINNA